MKVKELIMAIAAGVALAGPALAQGPESGSASERVVPNFSHVIPNIPGKSLVAVEVVFPPGIVSPAHHHAKSAFIYAYVVSGSISSQVEGQPARIYKAGESFFEEPGAHHLASGSASKTEPAKLLAVFIVDTDDKELTTPDK
jgi:quercetin dioxygenase-like cupin family protein